MLKDSDRYKYFQKPFIDAVNEKISKDKKLSDSEIISRSIALVESNKHLLVDHQSVEHLHTTCFVIAAFEKLKIQYDIKKALEVIKYAFVDSLSFVTLQTEQFLNESKNPFRAMVDVSKTKEEEYGETFTFYRRQDDESAYLLEVKACYYCKILNLNNAKALMPIFCDFDTIWMRAINPEKHGFKFDRPETIGTGGEICKFYFTRIDLS